MYQKASAVVVSGAVGVALLPQTGIHINSDWQVALSIIIGLAFTGALLSSLYLLYKKNV
ncbi:hypothetical protein [Convivina intestini]|uniref:Uncharacterized protein n=1 Tax=Convivina intestini TaxID=1505726 RepID=A0A2U1DFW5_9LACO|nr:hypothetical protein [Convivina intestini]PVY86459.1 hypothetical protein C7384_101378 [Convivina intestini]CAH1850189.1 hypothetical protein R077811_00038 [Convivina intestini]CAH1852172.1 hypothetical protein R078131_00411 [Convivina intestini]SDB83862.1 hypothetical protein SAMN05216341_101370 [Leuconostocaceae bacterium R-53105]